MPELPEVELVRRSLLPLRGRRILDVEVLLPSVLSSDPSEMNLAEGQKIMDIHRRGKQIFAILEQGVLTLHLGMTGEVTHGDRSEVKHVALRLRFDDGTYLNYIDQRRFGAVGYARTEQEFVSQHHLGPDILEIPSSEFIGSIRRSRRPVKSILLDQSVSAGIGNLYADEAMFQARIHPMRAGISLTEAEANLIWKMARRVIRKSLAKGTDFSLLPKGYLLRVREERGPCPRCHGALKTIAVGGRTTVLCPRCQAP